MGLIDLGVLGLDKTMTMNRPTLDIMAKLGCLLRVTAKYLASLKRPECLPPKITKLLQWFQTQTVWKVEQNQNSWTQKIHLSQILLNCPKTLQMKLKRA